MSVELNVRSRMDEVLKDLENISKKVKETQEEISKANKSVGDEQERQSKRTETFLSRLRGTSARVAKQIKDDFKALASLNALSGALELSEQFKGTLTEAATLNDTIRKLGTTLGITQDKFGSFQSKMVKGLGAIGLSSDVASKALEGLAETPVRGEENLLAYAKTAGQLSSISRQQGKEGEIASGISRVIQARGGNVNDVKEMQKVAEDLRKIFAATGKGPTESLKAMETMFTGMASDFRKTITSTGLTNLAVAGQVAGPNSTKFLEEFLSMSKIDRMAMEAQGFKGVFGEKGLDIEKFRSASKDILGRIGMDPRKAAQTLGLSEEAAEGFIRLAENLDKVKEAQEKVAASTGTLAEQYKSSMGLGESFRANINRVKAMLAEPLAYSMDAATNIMSGASESAAGAAAVVGGGGLLAAILAGGALRGIGGGIGGSLAKGAAAEAITGKETMPVYVTNFGELKAMEAGAGMLDKVKGVGGKLGGLAAFAGKAGLVGAAGAAGYGIGTLAEKYSPTFEGKTAEGFQGGLIERVMFKLDSLLGGEASTMFEKNQKMLIELNKSELKATRQVGRGPSV